MNVIKHISLRYLKDLGARALFPETLPPTSPPISDPPGLTFGMQLSPTSTSSVVTLHFGTVILRGSGLATTDEAAKRQAKAMS